MQTTIHAEAAAEVLAISAGGTRAARRTASSRYWQQSSSSATSSRQGVDTLVFLTRRDRATSTWPCCLQGQPPPVVEEELDVLQRTLARELVTKGNVVRWLLLLGRCSVRHCAIVKRLSVVQLRRIILDCAVELSTKTPVYATLIGARPHLLFLQINCSLLL